MPRKTRFSRKKRHYGRLPVKKPVYARTKASNARRVARGPFRRYVTTDPFPPVKYCKLHYSEAFTFTSGAAGVLGTEQVMNLNSLYDPNALAGGHQPYGHDELNLLYKNYKVYGVKFTLIFSNPSADNMVCAARISPPNGPQSLTGQSGTQVAEQPMSVLKYINNSGRQIVTITQYFPMSTILGVTPLQFKSAYNNSYTAAFGANPSAMPTLRISAGDANGVQGSTVSCQINMTFYTQCYERAPLAQS